MEHLSTNLRYCHLCHRFLKENEFDRWWVSDTPWGTETIRTGDCNVCRSIKMWRVRAQSFRRLDGTPVIEQVWGRDLLDMWHEANGRCTYCNVLMITERECHIDHIVARRVGGSNAHSNLALACYRCNISKSKKPLSEWQPKLDHVLPDDVLIARYADTHKDSEPLTLKMILADAERRSARSSQASSVARPAAR